MSITRRHRSTPILTDRVNYASSPPRPMSANGAGNSWQRTNGAAYEHEPFNWMAAPSTAGKPAASGAADTNRDGMPDDRERAHGLNSKAGDAGLDAGVAGIVNRFCRGVTPAAP